MPEEQPSFERDGDLVVPAPFTHSGWSETMLDGRYLSGIVAWGAEGAVDDPELQPARLTVDMFRPGTIAPLRVEHRVVRDGRRIRVVDVSISLDGTEICRGSSVWLRRAEPTTEPWEPPTWDVPPPESIEPPSRPEGMRDLPWEVRHLTGWGEEGTRRVWLRESRPFMAGEDPSPFLRAALAADMANGVVNASPAGLPYINADLTLTLARLPRGEWLGLEGTSRANADGVSTGGGDLYDQEGRIGQVLLVGLADARQRRP